MLSSSHPRLPSSASASENSISHSMSITFQHSFIWYCIKILSVISSQWMLSQPNAYWERYTMRFRFAPSFLENSSNYDPMAILAFINLFQILQVKQNWCSAFSQVWVNAIALTSALGQTWLIMNWTRGGQSTMLAVEAPLGMTRQSCHSKSFPIGQATFLCKISWAHEYLQPMKYNAFSLPCW